MRKIKFCVLACAFLTSCVTLEYEKDLLAMSPVEGNIAEYPVIVNGRPCKADSDHIGTCTIVSPRDKEIIVYVPPMDEAFTLSLECSFAEGQSFKVKEDIPEKVERKYKIPRDYYQYVRSRFLCTGRIYPLGTSEIVRNSFEILVRLYNSEYQARETPYVTKGYLVMGKYAKKTTCLKNNKWRFYTKETVIKAKGLEYCFSISEKGRINSWQI